MQKIVTHYGHIRARSIELCIGAGKMGTSRRRRDSDGGL